MRVLFVNTSERKGGASVAANRLMEALNNNGVKVKMLVMEKETDTPTVVGIGNGILSQRHFFWERFYIWRHLYFSRKHLFEIDVANTGFDITKLREFKEADVIHLHWINQGMLSLKGIRQILLSGKPVIWTMHDMWPLTAICHYAYECNRFTESCGHCRLLRSNSKNDLSHKVFLRKQQMLEGQKVCYVAVSSWLASQAKESTLLQGQRIETIPNSLMYEKFILKSQDEARKKLSIKEKYVIAFGAARIDTSIKGFKFLQEALQILTSQKGFSRDDIRLILFGGIKDEGILKSLSIPYTYMGYQRSESQLSDIYSASDALVSSSYYETFGQTLTEALACGCLPVAFDGSGQADIIQHKENGYLATHLSATSLADGLEWALLQPHDKESRLKLRGGVIRKYSGDAVAAKYINLYEQLTKQEI